MAKTETADYEVASSVRIPASVAYSDNVRSGIAAGFAGRNDFLIVMLKALEKHIAKYGVTKGLEKFKAKLEV